MDSITKFDLQSKSTQFKTKYESVHADHGFS